MRKTYLLLATLTALVLLAGCANTVRTRTSTFMAPDAELGQGTIAVQPAESSQNGSLEFGLYRSKVEDKLKAEGYTIAPPESAEYIARLGFDVSEVDQEPRYTGMRFVTGFGSYWVPGFGPYYRRHIHRDVHGFDPIFGPYPRSYYRLRFGYDPFWAWGYDPFYHHHGFGYYEDRLSYQPEFVRTLSVHIAKVPSSEEDQAKRVYEVEAVSAGSCPIMSVVFDEMLAAIFHDFPGENGAVKTVRVEGETRCG